MLRAELLEHLSVESSGLLDAAAAAGLDAEVPTCPEWRVRDLLAHTGEVYHWVTRVLHSEQSGFPTGWPSPADDELADWVRSGHAAVSDALRSAAPDLRCWTFWPVDDPAWFWARRMADETAIHRVDAQLAAGGSTPVAADLAEAGIEELLAGLLAMRPVGVRVEAPVRLAVVPESAQPWLVTVTPERIAAVADVGPADLTVSGSASDVFTWLWNRGGDVRIDGDPAAAEVWRRVRVRLK